MEVKCRPLESEDSDPLNCLIDAIEIFTLEEKSGGLPYTATWISLDGRQCAKHFPTIDELYGFDKHLETLGREASLQLNIRECKVKLSA